MTFHGVFVGIDRCASSEISELRFAKRDAVALYSLFTDTFGGQTTLLNDETATRAEFERRLEGLTSCAEDDVVVVSFSGHGTRTHHLVAYDTDKRDIEGTGISLESLANYLDRIPSRRLICVLDCCFSGGMGAKILEVESVPRDISSTDDLLNQMSGDGRLILTASTATEPAWENTKLSHGLLTYHLIQALLGAEEVVRSGKLSVYRLLDFVTERVLAFSTQNGRPQQPTLRGEIDGDFSWPVFKPGRLYREAFPEKQRPKVTPDIQSLLGYGFPQPLLDAWAGAIPSLNQLQIDAINEFDLLEGKHLAVSSPTSSGKTMVGELAALKGVLERRRAIFLLPLKALVNDKFRHFNQVYGAFGVRTIRATGDSTVDDIQPLMRSQYDLCLMTYEKFTALALGAPHILEQVGTIVVDEVQMIADESRGMNLEFILTLLRMRRRQGVEPQIIALSAVIGDTNGMERWLGARLLRRTERPVPLDEGVLRADGSFRFISSDTGEEQVIKSFIVPEFRKGSSQDWVIPLARRLVKERKSVIVFRETKGEARGCAGYLSENLGLPPAQDVLDRLPTGDPSLSSSKLRESLSGGVGFHIADLDAEERQVIEGHFRDRSSPLKVLAATTTLAMGVNTPTEAVIIAGLEHPGPKPYSVAEYKNIAGRAGRLGQASRGTSYIIALNANEEHYYWSRYVTGQPEDVTSRFLTDGADDRSLVIRVLAAAQRSGQGMTAEEIVGFLEESFGAFQQRQQSTQWKWNQTELLEALHSLHKHQLVEADSNGAFRLTELGRVAGEAGIEVESIVRLVQALRNSNAESISDPALITATQLTVELDREYFPINKRSTQKEPQTWLGEIRRQNIPHSIISALQQFVSQDIQPTLRAKKAVACLLWITDKSLAEIEDILTQHGGRFDGAAGPIRSVKARTCDFLPIVARVAEILHPDLVLGERVSRLLTRLEIGVSPVAVELAALAGSRLARGDYQQLLKARRCTLDAIEQSTDEELLSCVSGDQQKLTILREAVRINRERQSAQNGSSPILPPYEA
jgi:replicative superfamily II helicase